MQDKTYNIYDGCIGIWREPKQITRPLSIDDFQRRMRLTGEAKKADEAEQWEINRKNRALNEECFEECKDFYMDLRGLLMANGWRVQQDPYIVKHYRCLRDTHHAGQYRDIAFRSSCTGRHIEFRFYEPVIRDNKNGGEYTSNKIKVMPYLKRLRVIRALNLLTGYLKEHGYSDHSKTYPEDGLAAIMKHRAELCDFQGKDFYERERQTYNVHDHDVEEMFDGDLRYFWNYHGRLERGKVYRNINNMWWIHTGPYSYWNVANFELFTWKPGMGSRKKWTPEQVQKKISKKLEAAIKAQDFERAIVLRDLIKKAA